jgi:hypothetical protein
MNLAKMYKSQNYYMEQHQAAAECSVAKTVNTKYRVTAVTFLPEDQLF